jgi:hypothetical protein
LSLLCIVDYYLDTIGIRYIRKVIVPFELLKLRWLLLQSHICIENARKSYELDLKHAHLLQRMYS